MNWGACQRPAMGRTSVHNISFLSWTMMTLGAVERVIDRLLMEIIDSLGGSDD
jgi:hypothetical protein